MKLRIIVCLLASSWLSSLQGMAVPAEALRVGWETKVTRADAEETKKVTDRRKAIIGEELEQYLLGPLVRITETYLEPAPWQFAPLWLEKSKVDLGGIGTIMSLRQLSSHTLACALYPNNNIMIWGIESLDKPARVLSGPQSGHVPLFLVPYKENFVCGVSQDASIWDLSQKSDAPTVVIKDVTGPALFMPHDILVGANFPLTQKGSASNRLQYEFWDCSGTPKKLSTLEIGRLNAESSQYKMLIKLTDTTCALVPDVGSQMLCFIDISDINQPKIAGQLTRFLTNQFVIKDVVKLFPTRIAVIANASRLKYSKSWGKETPYGELAIIDITDINKPKVEAIFKDTRLDHAAAIIALSEEIVAISYYNHRVSASAQLQIWDISDVQKPRLVSALKETAQITCLIPLEEENSFALSTRNSIEMYRPNTEASAAISNLHKDQREKLATIIVLLEKQAKLTTEQVAELDSLPQAIRSGIKKSFKV